MTTVSSTSNSSAILYLVLLILLTLLVAIGIGLFMMFARRRREEQQLKRALNSVCYEVRLPKANDVDVHAAEQMFAALTSISSVPTKWHEKLFKTPNYVSFEIVGLPESIRFYVIVPKKFPNWLKNKYMQATRRQM